VGYLERGTPPVTARAYDAVVWTPAATRPDPCAAFKTNSQLDAARPDRKRE